MINLMISGINGSMGKQVYEHAVNKGINVVCGIDRVTVGQTECPVYKSFEEVKHFADVIVDFSSPELTDKLLDYALANKIPSVICTTGFDDALYQKMRKASESVAIFQSENTSLGINVLLKLCKIASTLLNGYDVEIIEKHHRSKADSPSGTALAIIKEFTGEQNLYPIFGRNGKCKRKPQEIGVHSVRGGTTVGKHEIYFYGDNECISISHTADSKGLFALGAIKAVEFIKNKKCGFFTMNDIINFK